MSHNIKCSRKMQVFLKMALAFLVTLLLSYTVFSHVFLLLDDTTVIKIEDTAKKNHKSGGTDVRIVSVKINDRVIPFQELEFEEGMWIYLDDLLVSVNPTNPTFITYETQKAEKIEVELQKHEGSGIVRIFANEKVIGEMDLYSSFWDSIIFEKDLGRIAILSNFPMFLALYIAVILFLWGWVAAFKHLKWQKSPWKRYGAVMASYTLFFLGCFIYGQLKAGIQITLVVSLLGFFLLLIYMMVEKYNKKAIVVLSNILLLFISSFVLAFAVENINNNISNITWNYLLGNVVIYFTVLLSLFLLLANMTASAIVGSIVICAYGVANYYVVLFRGSPIVPGDFFTITTAGTVASNYHYVINWEMFSSIMITVIWCCAILSIFNGANKTGRRETLFCVIPLGLLIGCLLGSDFYKPTLDFWNLNNNTKKYGVAMSLISNIRRMRVAEPEDYSYETIEAMWEQYKTLDQIDKKVNVIAIMNEAYSDLSILSDCLDSDAYMPYYNSMSEDTIKGRAMVSTFGGGTSNTEYEFLTGNSIGFIPGTIPYQQFVLKDTFSLAKVLKERGYTTTAIHPYDKRGYSRYRVYPYLGFDKFIDVTAFDNPELSRDLYITDEESYKKIIEVFEENQRSGVPSFIFNVTMQNHSGYTTGFYGDNSIKVPEKEGEFPDVEEYLTLIKESDEAIRVLIEYFREVEDPTAIVMFGDHQPKIEDEFYEEMMGKPLSQWSLEEVQKRYEVPFFIWTNFDIDEQDDLFTSVNYLSGIMFEAAGIPLVPYQNFLLKTMEIIPAMNINGYMDEVGRWHSYNEESAKSPLLENYWELQYNNMFASKKCSKWFGME